jgi:hypothetical protein
MPAAFSLGEALTGGAKCSVRASGRDFGSQCDHQILGWSVDPYPGLQALLICCILESAVNFLVVVTCQGLLPVASPKRDDYCPS